MKSLLPILFAVLAGCAHAGGQAETASRCNVTSLGDVFREPPGYFGERFCGEALAVPEGRVLKIFPPSPDIPTERNDVVMFLDGRTADALDAPDRQPFRLYMEGVIGGMGECFQSPSSGMETVCTPFRHPISITVSSYRLLGRP
jgi:hypothetical protein